MAGMSFQEPDQDIFSVDVTLTSKPEKYSALLPPKAYDSPTSETNSWGLQKNFLQSICGYYDVMTHFFTILCGLNAYICLP